MTGDDVLESKGFPELPGSYEEHMAAVGKAVTELLATDQYANGAPAPTGQPAQPGDASADGGVPPVSDSGQAAAEAPEGGYTEPVHSDVDPDADSEMGAGTGGGKPMVVIAGTWPDHVVATVYKLGADQDPVSYQVPYSMAADGSVALGTPEEVELSVSVVPVGGVDPSTSFDQQPDATGMDAAAVPAAEALDTATKMVGAMIHGRRRGRMQTKAGRVLSAASLGLITGALERLVQVLAAAGVPIDPAGAVAPADSAVSGSDADDSYNDYDDGEDMQGKAAVISAAELEEMRLLQAQAAVL